MTAGDGRAALEAVESFRPDLVVLDVMLPDLDGFEVQRRLVDRGVARAGAVPHRPRRHRGQGPRTDPRRRRLRHEALQPGGAGCPHPCGLAPGRGRRADERATRVRRPRDGRGSPRGLPGRSTRRPHADRVRPPAVPLAEPPPCAVEGADPRPRLALRLRRRRVDRRDLHRRTCARSSRRRAPGCSTRCAASAMCCGFRRSDDVAARAVADRHGRVGRDRSAGRRMSSPTAPSRRR